MKGSQMVATAAGAFAAVTVLACGPVAAASEGGEQEQAYGSSDWMASWGVNLADSNGFIHALIASFAVIVVSEIGDKTFFIAAIMAMRHPRSIVFGGAILALGTMTVLSAMLGYATTVIPRIYTYYASTALFVFFGLKLLKEGWYMSPDEGAEELEEVQQELKKKDEEREGDPEAGVAPASLSGLKKSLMMLVSPIFVQAFTLTFLAEWGDRSQITTIILGAREDPIGVSIGGTVGHALCSGIAVIGGQLLAKRISVRTVTLIGGVVFLIFAATSLLRDPNAE